MNSFICRPMFPQIFILFGEEDKASPRDKRGGSPSCALLNVFCGMVLCFLCFCFNHRFKTFLKF
jgi:hypothetical protein